MQPKGRALNGDIFLCSSVVWSTKARTRPGDKSLARLQTENTCFSPGSSCCGADWLGRSGRLWVPSAACSSPATSYPAQQLALVKHCIPVHFPRTDRQVCHNFSSRWPAATRHPQDIDDKSINAATMCPHEVEGTSGQVVYCVILNTGTFILKLDCVDKYQHHLFLTQRICRCLQIPDELKYQEAMLRYADIH